MIIAEVRFRIIRLPFGNELEIRAESSAGQEFGIREPMPDSHTEAIWDIACRRGCDRLKALMIGHEQKYGAGPKPIKSE